MESWIRGVFLTLCLAGAAGWANAEENTDANAENEPLIEPEIKRSRLKVADIDTENFEVGAYGGLMSVEDFGVNGTWGLSLGYHVTEDVFFQINYGNSSTDETSFERLVGVDLLTDEERDLTYYNLAIGWKWLPGEAFIGRSLAFNTQFYALLGAGSTEFAGDDRFTLMFGGGYKVLLTDYLSIHVDVRNHLFDLELLSEKRTVTNLEYGFGITAFF